MDNERMFSGLDEDGATAVDLRLERHLAGRGMSCGERREAPERCRGCAIRQRGICSALTDEELTRLARTAHHRKYAPGHVILRSDDQPAFRAAVVSGVVKLTKLLVDGRHQIVDLLFPADFVGRLIRDRRRISPRRRLTSSSAAFAPQTSRACSATTRT